MLSWWVTKFSQVQGKKCMSIGKENCNGLASYPVGVASRYRDLGDF